MALPVAVAWGMAALSAASMLQQMFNPAENESEINKSKGLGANGQGIGQAFEAPTDPLATGGVGDMFTDMNSPVNQPLVAPTPDGQMPAPIAPIDPNAGTGPPPGGGFGWLETMQALGPALQQMAPLLKGDPDQITKKTTRAIPQSGGGGARQSTAVGSRGRQSAGDILKSIRRI